jgi:phosphopantothenoylcysteine decarboxylase/phosphopantothenate--cysteine ligase
MYLQPLVVENMQKLTELGILFVRPEEEEEKAKLAPPEAILANLIQILSTKDFAGKRILITAGPTVEHLDPIRVITNPSSGKMGSAIAFEASRRGADVTVIHGPIDLPLPRVAKRIQVHTTREMYNATISEIESGKHDVLIATAAAADYAPVAQQKKIQTHNSPKLTLELQSTPKIIDEIKKRAPSVFLLAFRAQAGLSRDELVTDGYERLRRANADLIAVNDVGRHDIGFGSEYNELILIDATGQTIHLERAPKRVIARQLLDEVSKRLST